MVKARAVTMETVSVFMLIDTCKISPSKAVMCRFLVEYGTNGVCSVVACVALGTSLCRKTGTFYGPL